MHNRPLVFGIKDDAPRYHLLTAVLRLPRSGGSEVVSENVRQQGQMGAEFLHKQQASSKTTHMRRAW